MQEGNVYIVDMVHLLQDLPGSNICPAPTGLFYVKPSRNLYPIAIQLEPNGVIFTPSAPYLDWLQAKMYFQCGNWQVCSSWAPYTISLTFKLIIYNNYIYIYIYMAVESSSLESSNI